MCIPGGMIRSIVQTIAFHSSLRFSSCLCVTFCLCICLVFVQFVLSLSGLKSLSLSVYLSVCLYSSLSVSFCLSVCLSGCLSVCLSLSLSLTLSLSISVSTCLCLYLSLLQEPWCLQSSLLGRPFHDPKASALEGQNYKKKGLLSSNPRSNTRNNLRYRQR